MQKIALSFQGSSGYVSNPFNAHTCLVLESTPAECVAVCCSVLQCVAVCCVAVCCSVLQCVAVCCSVLCCSVLQCVAVCCSMYALPNSHTLLSHSPCILVCTPNLLLHIYTVFTRIYMYIYNALSNLHTLLSHSPCILV